MNESSEISKLLTQAAGGEQTAIDAMFRRYEERIKRMVRLRLNHKLRGRVDASDVVQETFLDAAKHLTEYLRHPSVPFFLWLRHLASRKLIDVHRRHLGAQARDVGNEVALRGHAGPAATSDSLAAQLMGRFSSPSSAAQKVEVREKVRSALEDLDPIDREVLTLRHFEQLSNVETAAVLAIGASTASTRYLRALARLKTLLKEVSGLVDRP